jgi:hypothetical protein
LAELREYFAGAGEIFPEIQTAVRSGVQNRPNGANDAAPRKFYYYPEA